MLKGTRIFSLDICDYNNDAVCNLYDNQSDISGQATDIHESEQRNGWKELSFKLPTMCSAEQGEEANYRMQYLIADYRLKIQTNKKTDYYIISEPRIVHNGKEKNLEVTAGHISQLLKTKSLGLEFSDEEGNNVGTAKELLTTILDGTGWAVGEVAFFGEDDDPHKEKVRSIIAEVKTGAFMLIAKLCEKFDAKPIYNGDTRTVDIVPMNPFSEVEGSEVPQEVLDGAPALELNYGNNVTSITRTLNTENLVTRLYAYGAYGSKTTGLCSLQTAKHSEYTMTIDNSYPEGQEFFFTDGNGTTHYFTATTALQEGDTLIWSDLDQTSRSYVWNGNDEENPVIYKTYYEPNDYSAAVELTPTNEVVANRFDYLMDFNYYDKIGLLTDEMALDLAVFQRTMPAVIDASTEATQQLTDKEQELSRIAESNTGFLRLNVGSYAIGTDGALQLVLDKTDEYPDGIIYRSDYDQARRNYFSWYCASALKDNGDPVSGIGSVIYIVHDTDPVTWEKAYVKEIDGTTEPMDYSVYSSDNPDTITLWISRSDVPSFRSTDRFYLFSTNSISGRLGVRESELESLQQTLTQATKVVTEEHPTYFIWDNELAPDVTAVKQSYGWYYRSFSNRTDPGELWFCYGVAGNEYWHRAIISETEPEVINQGYYFNLKSKKLYHGESDTWVYIADAGIAITSSESPVTGEITRYYAPNAEAKRLSQSFSKVAYYCLRHDMLYKGIYDEYIYTVTDAELPVGNYAFKSDYGFYWVFSTDQTIPKRTDTAKGREGTIWIDTIKYLVYQTEDIANIVKPEAKPYEAIDFPVVNELTNVSILDGSIIKETGVEENSNVKKRTNHILVYGGINYTYNVPAGSCVIYYDSNRRYLDYEDIGDSGKFNTPVRTKYIRVVFPGQPDLSTHYIQVEDWENKLFIKDTQYTILSPLTTGGDKTGITDLMKAFADTADECYLTYLKNYKDAQAVIKEKDDALKDSLKDLYREGYWQNNEYIEGNEDQLYDDAIDNLEKIAKPEATYDVRFLDLYSSNQNVGYSVDENLDEIEWPDIDITYAIHLIDDEIDINCWAFIDKIDKCYDQPWRTQLTINTDLSLIAQHSFTDVMTRIAEVANSVSAKRTIYNRASIISGSKTIATNKLEGTIKANQTLFEGGKSNWYTDNNGGMIFESADGQSAMMLTGYGFCVANTKNADGDWVFRTFGSGQGFSADEITTGEMSAVHLQAGTITTDLLHASVGQELEIGSNKALMLYATVDGYRPSGGLKTKVSNGDGTYSEVGEGDSYVEIKAKEGDDPAYINIRTGGLLNLYGSEMNLTAASAMNLTSNSEMNLTSSTMNLKAAQMNQDKASVMNVTGGTVNIRSIKEYDSEGHEFVNSGKLNLLADSEMYIATGGNINMETGGTFTLRSNNVLIDQHGNALFKGTLIAWAGRIAGFTIAGEVVPETGYSETITLPSFDDFPETGTEDILYIAEDTEKNYYWTGETYEETKVSYDDNNHPTSMPISGYKYKRQYIYAGATDTVSATGDGVYVGTDGLNLGGKLRYDLSRSSLYVDAEKVLIGKVTPNGSFLTMDATTGKIQLLANSEIDINAGSTITVSSGETVNIGTLGEVNIGNLSSPFTIGRHGGTIDDPDHPGETITIPNASYIYNGMPTLDSTLNGIYLGTDGIALGGGNFVVTNLGALTANNASVKGTIHAEEGRIGEKADGTGGWIIGTNLIYSNSKKIGLNAVPGTNSSNIAFWAGAANDQESSRSGAAFYVTHAGYLKSTNGSIGGWNIGSNSLTNTGGSVGMYSGGTGTVAFWAGSITATSAPFYVTNTGVLHAAGAKIDGSGTFSGTITATDGEFTGVIKAKAGGWIGGWSIATNALYKGDYKIGMATSNFDTGSTQTDYVTFWAGANSQSTINSAPFRVTQNGKLYATGAHVEGTLNAGSGSTIGGFTIAAHSITSQEDNPNSYIQIIDTGKVNVFSGNSYASLSADLSVIPYLQTSSIKPGIEGIKILKRTGSTSVNGETVDIYSEYLLTEGWLKNVTVSSTQVTISSGYGGNNLTISANGNELNFTVGSSTFTYEPTTPSYNSANGNYF